MKQTKGEPSTPPERCGSTELHRDLSFDSPLISCFDAPHSVVQNVTASHKTPILSYSHRGCSHAAGAPHGDVPVPISFLPSHYLLYIMSCPFTSSPQPLCPNLSAFSFPLILAFQFLASLLVSLLISAFSTLLLVSLLLCPSLAASINSSVTLISM